jgi:hypothetical protein
MTELANTRDGFITVRAPQYLIDQHDRSPQITRLAVPTVISTTCAPCPVEQM